MEKAVIKYSDLVVDDGAFEKALVKIEQFGEKIVESAKKTKADFNKALDLGDLEGIAKYEKEMEKLTSANKKQQTSLKTLNTRRQQNARKITKETEAVKANNKVLRLTSQIQNTTAGSIENLRLKLSLVTNAWSKLSESELENTKRGKRLVASKKELTATLLKLEQKTGDNRRQVGDYSKGLGKLRGDLINVSNAAGITTGAFGAFRVLRNSVEIVKDFEKQNATLSGVLQKTKEEITDLTADSQRLGSITVKTAGEVAGLQTEYARLGFSQSEIIDLTESTIEGSIAMNSELSETAKLVGAVVNSYDDLSSTDAPMIIDSLSLATAKSALDFEKLSTGLPIVLGAANALNVPLTEVTATLGKLADAGIDTSSGATALRNIFIESAARGINYKEALNLIRNSTDKLTTANNIFGKRAAVSALVIAKNAKGVEELTTQLNNAAGASKEMAEKELNTLDGSLKLLTSAWEGLVLKMNEATDGGNILSQSVRYLSENLETIFKVVGIATGAWIAYNVVQKAGNVISRISAGLTAIRTTTQIASTSATVAGTAAQKAFNIATKANVLGLLVALLLSAVTAYYAFRDSATEAQKAQRAFNEAKEAGREDIANTIKQEKEVVNERIALLKQELTVRRASGEDSKKLDKEFQDRKKAILKEDISLNVKQVEANILQMSKLDELEKQRIKDSEANTAKRLTSTKGAGQAVISRGKAELEAIKKEFAAKQGLLDEDNEQRIKSIKDYNKQIKKLDNETEVTIIEGTEEQKKLYLKRQKELELLRRRLEDLRDDSIKADEAREVQKTKRKFDREISQLLKNSGAKIRTLKGLSEDEIRAIKGLTKLEADLLIELEKAKQRSISKTREKFSKERLLVLEEANRLEDSLIQDDTERKLELEREKSFKIIQEISKNSALSLERKLELQKIEEDRLSLALERINLKKRLKSLENAQLIDKALVEQRRGTFKSEKAYEDFKAKEFLRIQREYLTKRLELLQGFSGDEYKVEIEQLKAQIAGLGDPPPTDKWQAFGKELSDVFSLVAKQIVKSLEDSLKATKEGLTRQQKLVDVQASRAEKGLTNTLAFEQRELAKREAQTIAREKKLNQVKKLESYWNTYNANISSLKGGEDSSDAIVKTLRDIAVIEAITATASFGDGGIVGIDGYVNSNGITKGGSHASGNDVTAKFEGGEGFFSRKEVASMGEDNFRRIKHMAGKGQIDSDFFSGQRKGFVTATSPIVTVNKTDERLVSGMQELKRAIENKPVQTWDVAESTIDTIKMIETVSKKNNTKRNTYIIKKPRL